ncbi:hypothetical protein GF376_01445 [Candidatus Peregrinibacteria bacterium]|nr:hypothetical protein [Candidatus Peregrinibacteria bacterium]
MNSSKRRHLEAIPSTGQPTRRYDEAETVRGDATDYIQAPISSSEIPTTRMKEANHDRVVVSINAKNSDSENPTIIDNSNPATDIPASPNKPKSFYRGTLPSLNEDDFDTIRPIATGAKYRKRIPKAIGTISSIVASAAIGALGYHFSERLNNNGNNNSEQSSHQQNVAPSNGVDQKTDHQSDNKTQYQANWRQMKNNPTIYRNKGIEIAAGESGVVLMIETKNPEKLEDKGVKPVLTKTFAANQQCLDPNTRTLTDSCNAYVLKYYSRCFPQFTNEWSRTHADALSSVEYNDSGVTMASYSVQVEMCSKQEQEKLAKEYAFKTPEEIRNTIYQKLLDKGVTILPNYTFEEKNGLKAAKAAYATEFQGTK